MKLIQEEIFVVHIVFAVECPPAQDENIPVSCVNGLDNSELDKCLDVSRDLPRTYPSEDLGEFLPT